MADKPLARPLLRGAVHVVAFMASLPVGLLLVLAADSAVAQRALAVYAVSVSLMLGVSSIYHRVSWSPQRRRWMRRLDHAMIFVVLAGSYTPWAVLVLDGPLSRLILVAMWAGAAVGIGVHVVWVDAPKPVIAATYAAVGLLALGALPAWLDGLGAAGTALVAAAGGLSALGAMAYATGRPNPWPAVFGYHEIFHVLVTASVAVHTLAIVFYALD